MRTSPPSQGALAGVLEAIGDAVYAMDRDERILFANRRALELWGKDIDAVVGQRLLDVFPGIEEGEPYRAYRSVLANRKRIHLETVAPALGGRWISLDAQPGPQGGLVVVFRDIDDRKRAEAALRESEERFRSMLEALPQIAFVIRPDGEAGLRWNAANSIWPASVMTLTVNPESSAFWAISSSSASPSGLATSP